MAQEDRLRVKLYPATLDEQDVIDFEVDYVSFVNTGTFGPPPLVAPKDGLPPLADVNDEVLYVNTSLVAAFTIERL